MTGRPSLYTAKLADYICEQLAEGKSLVAICRNDDMPSYRTVMNWLDSKEDFCTAYVRAREVQAHYLAEENLDIADDDSLDVGFTDDGKPFVKGDNIQRAKLKIDTRKWYAAKVLPKKYGDKTTTELTGPNGGPIETRATNVSDDELNARILELAAKAGAGGVAAPAGRKAAPKRPK